MGQEIFALVGMICALMICAAVLLVVLARYNNSEAVDYLNGMMEQLGEVSADISEFYGPGDRIPASSVRRILHTIRRRERVYVEDMRANDAAKAEEK